MKTELFCAVVAAMFFSASASARPFAERSSDRDFPSMNPANFEKVGSVYRVCRQQIWDQTVEGGSERRSRMACKIYRSKDYKGPIPVDPIPSLSNDDNQAPDRH